uniref:Transcriptional repressor Tup1 N-terminal domain-containing protein n=4 Tax=Hemiselmis andersenii TaxID=464988 RepID=A0A7S1HJV2_HEMAN|mmetsp:Transcript_62343/g.149929  ORF Transcript_62343/g.149929 Transcript_62343/m.149929 type:complete len:507 (+) Transcript_62343:150-1670(+)
MYGGGNVGVPDLLETLKSEYEQLLHEGSVYKAQKEDYERKLEAQVSELTLLQQSLNELERTHLSVKAMHEEEIRRLRQQLESMGAHPKPAAAAQLEGAALAQMFEGQRAAGGPSPTALPGGEAAAFPLVGAAFGAAAKIGEGHAAAQGEWPIDSRGRPLDDWNVVQNPTAAVKTNIELQHTLDHDSVVCCVRFSNNGRYVATGCHNAAVLYDAETGERLALFANQGVVESQAALEQLELGDSYVRSVCFSPDSRFLVAGAEDKTIKIWDIQARRLRHSLVGHTKDIYSVDYSTDGRYVVSGSGDKRAKLWDVSSGECVRTYGDDDGGPMDGVTSVALSPDGRLIAAGSLDRTVRVWDCETGTCLERFEGHSDSVYAVAFAPDGKYLATGSLDKSLKLWDISAAGTRAPGGVSKCRYTFEGHKDFVLSVAFAPQDTWLISGSKDRSVQFWDTHNISTAAEEGPSLILQGHQNSVISVAHSPAGKVFATGSGDKRARIWRYSYANGER